MHPYAQNTYSQITNLSILKNKAESAYYCVYHIHIDSYDDANLNAKWTETNGIWKKPDENRSWRIITDTNEATLKNMGKHIICIH